MKAVFRRMVSKGSRFNQIYVPKDMEHVIEAGDIVEVKLLKKHVEICYKNQEKLSSFKEYLIKNVFLTLTRFSGIKAVFVVGSFLQKTFYNDIDLIIIADNPWKDFEKEIEKALFEEFSQRFHIILLNPDKLRELIEKDPLTRSMLSCHISNKDIDLNYRTRIDEQHIKFLLMMPEDLLEIEMPSRIVYNSIQRLVTIERFIDNKPLDIKDIRNEIEKLFSKYIIQKIINNKEINKSEWALLRKAIEEKINRIKKMISHGKK